ncbi:unnamed protein product [Caenorhabditis brenneri]
MPLLHNCLFVQEVLGLHNDFRFVPLKCTSTNVLLPEIGDYDPHVQIFERFGRMKDQFMNDQEYEDTECFRRIRFKMSTTC